MQIITNSQHAEADAAPSQTPDASTRSVEHQGDTALTSAPPVEAVDSANSHTRLARDNRNTHSPSDGVEVSEANTRATGDTGPVPAEPVPLEFSEKMTEMERTRLGLLVGTYKLLDGDPWGQKLEILQEIRDERLYRELYPTYEEFCQKELGVTRSNVNRQFRSMAVALQLATVVAKPTKESLVRPLLKLADADTPGEIGTERPAIDAVEEDE